MAPPLPRDGLPGETVVVSLQLLGNESPVRRFELGGPGQAEVIRYGRSPKSDLQIEHRGCSWAHGELRLRRPAAAGRQQGADSTAADSAYPVGALAVLTICDLSNNGTGVQPPGDAGLVRLTKGVEAPIADGSLVILPMMLKKMSEAELQRDNKRATFRVCVSASSPIERPAVAGAAVEQPPLAEKRVQPSDDVSADGTGTAIDSKDFLSEKDIFERAWPSRDLPEPLDHAHPLKETPGSDCVSGEQEWTGVAEHSVFDLRQPEPPVENTQDDSWRERNRSRSNRSKRGADCAAPKDSLRRSASPHSTEGAVGEVFPANGISPTEEIPVAPAPQCPPSHASGAFCGPDKPAPNSISTATPPEIMGQLAAHQSLPRPPPAVHGLGGVVLAPCRPSMGLVPPSLLATDVTSTQDTIRLVADDVAITPAVDLGHSWPNAAMQDSTDDVMPTFDLWPSSNANVATFVSASGHGWDEQKATLNQGENAATPALSEVNDGGYSGFDQDWQELVGPSVPAEDHNKAAAGDDSLWPITHDLEAAPVSSSARSWDQLSATSPPSDENEGDWVEMDEFMAEPRIAEDEGALPSPPSNGNDRDWVEMDESMTEPKLAEDVADSSGGPPWAETAVLESPQQLWTAAGAGMRS